VSAFPAIVGPVLLITAHEHGPAFAASAANGTLLGLVALSGFAAAYGRAAQRWGWRAGLAVAWAAAAALGLLVGAVAADPPAGLAAAVVSLVLAHRALPRPQPGGVRLAVPRWDLPVRMALTLALVAALAAAAGRLGAVVGGILAALPVLASVLAVFTHRQQGAAALTALLRGMLAGMGGFVAFCAAVSFLIVPFGATPAFLAAALAAVLAQAAAVPWLRERVLDLARDPAVAR
jgi:MFS family permease